MIYNSPIDEYGDDIRREQFQLRATEAARRRAADDRILSEINTQSSYNIGEGGIGIASGSGNQGYVRDSYSSDALSNLITLLDQNSTSMVKSFGDKLEELVNTVKELQADNFRLREEIEELKKWSDV